MSNKFLSLLPLIEDQKWTLNETGVIRNEKGQCPICAIVDVLSGGNQKFLTMAVLSWRLYLKEETMPPDEFKSIKEIVHSTDNYRNFEGFSLPVRQRLLKLIHVE
jgi:hypothetical protein